ncbi:MAG: hypothetical protein K0Q55_2188, partial [Verrucomicrobia bacterium]|nr:hypothetical protein [Verrucomicrobiota bacterium]
MKTLINRWIASLICAVTVVWNLPAAEPTVLFSTGFEAAEGYNLNANLAGQKGWEGDGDDSTFWNGLLDQAFEGLGQQAYIGFDVPPSGL